VHKLIFAVSLSVLLISCRTVLPERELFVEKPPVLNEDFLETERPLLFESDFLMSLFSNGSSTELLSTIVYPKINHDFLPIDPFLRLIELKKRYFLQIPIQISPFSDNTVTSLAANSEYFYAGTLRGGIYQFDRHLVPHEIIKPYNTLHNRSVTSILGMDNGEGLYIGTYSGLYSYDPDTQNLSLLNQQVRDKSVTSLFEKEGILYWAAANGEVFSLSTDSSPFFVHKFSSSVKRILEYQNNIVFALSDGSIYSLSDHEITALIIAEQHSTVITLNDIMKYRDMLLLLTGDGVIVLDQSMKILGKYCSDSIVLKGTLSEKYIYFATHSSGIIVYDTISKDISLWDLKMGISSLNIPAIEIWGNQIIVSTPEKGILLIDEELQEKL